MKGKGGCEGEKGAGERGNPRGERGLANVGRIFIFLFKLYFSKNLYKKILSSLRSVLNGSKWQKLLAGTLQSLVGK